MYPASDVISPFNVKMNETNLGEFLIVFLLRSIIPPYDAGLLRLHAVALRHTWNKSPCKCLPRELTVKLDSLHFWVDIEVTSMPDFECSTPSLQQLSALFLAALYWIVLYSHLFFLNCFWFQFWKGWLFWAKDNWKCTNKKKTDALSVFQSEVYMKEEKSLFLHHYIV